MNSGLEEIKDALLEFSEKIKHSRELTPFEKRVALSEFSEKLDKAEETYVDTVAGILKTSLDKIAASIRKILDKGDLLALQNLRVGYHDKMVDAIRSHLVSLYLYGKQSVYEELGKTDAVIRRTQSMMLWYRVKAEAIVTELEAKIKARALYLVLEGVRRNRPEKEIMAHIVGLTEALTLYDPDFEQKHPRSEGGRFGDKPDFDMPGVYGRSKGDVIDEVLNRVRSENTLYMQLDTDEAKKAHMEDLGMPELDYESYHENVAASAIENAAKEAGIRFEDLNEWVADNWDRPAGEERWDRLRAHLLSEESLIEAPQTIRLQELFDGRLGNLIDIIKKFLIGSASVQTVSAVNEGRIDGFTELKKDIGAYQWSALLDSHVCPICREIDGTYISPVDPHLDTLFPPIHANCRCILVGVLKNELDKYPIEITRLRYGDVKRWTKGKFWLAQ